MTPEECSQKMIAMMGALEEPNLTGACELVMQDYVDQVNESFNSACGPDGEAWDEIVYREVPPPPLQLSGALRESVVTDIQSANIDDDGMGFATTGDQLEPYALGQDEGEEFGRLKYVGWVQKKYGVQVHKRYISWHPGRPFLGLGSATLDKAATHGADEAATQALRMW